MLTVLHKMWLQIEYKVLSEPAACPLSVSDSYKALRFCVTGYRSLSLEITQSHGDRREGVGVAPVVASASSLQSWLRPQGCIQGLDPYLSLHPNLIIYMGIHGCPFDITQLIGQGVMNIHITVGSLKYVLGEWQSITTSHRVVFGARPLKASKWSGSCTMSRQYPIR